MREMAKVASISIMPSAVLLVLSLMSSCLAAGENREAFGRALDPNLMGLGKEKLTHFRFYWHDVASGKNPTAVAVVKPVNGSANLFGKVVVMDDALTVGPDLGSRLVGRAQGFYVGTAQEELVFLVAQNFAFLEGKYNGSTITMLGRDVVFDKVREMPIVGGSGLFRFARGYVEARTHTVDLKTGDANVEYNVYVLHY